MNHLDCLIVLSNNWKRFISRETKIKRSFKSIEPIFEKERIGDVKHSLAGIEKAKKLLGFIVICGFEEGLEKLIGRINL